MQIDIRPARLDDAASIAQVKNLTWPHESTKPGLIAAALVDSSHTTLVAAKAGRVMGFVDGFSTFSSQGINRWEVDLLAVHPDHRGQGIGTRLVRASTDSGRERGATIVRALIHLKNAYCSEKKCLYCPIGNKLISRS